MLNKCCLLFKTDVPLTRFFNTYLQFFHFSISALVCYTITRVNNGFCQTLLTSVDLPLLLLLFTVNITGLITLKYTKYYNHRVFVLSIVLSWILTLFVIVIGIINLQDTNLCVSNRILRRFLGFSGLVCLLVTILSQWSKINLILYYTNAPGNMTWVYMFFSFNWSTYYQQFYIPLGIICLLVTISTLSIHIVYLISNFNAVIRKPIFIIWVTCIAVMIINELIGVVVYLRGEGEGNMIEYVGNKLIIIFIVVNGIDIGFWIYGMLILRISQYQSIHLGVFGINEIQNISDND